MWNTIKKLKVSMQNKNAMFRKRRICFRELWIPQQSQGSIEGYRVLGSHINCTYTNSWVMIFKIIYRSNKIIGKPGMGKEAFLKKNCLAACFIKGKVFSRLIMHFDFGRGNNCRSELYGQWTFNLTKNTPNYSIN